MTDQHPIITPPSDLRWLWREQAPRYRDGGAGREEWLMERAAGWGYDQRGEVNEAQLQKARDEELEACCEWLVRDWTDVETADKLRAARRPKPPSDKEQALADFNWLVGRTLGRPEFDERSNRIRRALEALPDD
jgi:hypothetical protein